jgi:hypothetical protein
MFQTKLTTTTTIVSKPFKFDNVPINVVAVIMTCNQVLKQQVLKEHELMKAKITIDWHLKKQTCDSFVHIIKELQGNDSISQTPIELNGRHHSHWANLP